MHDDMISREKLLNDYDREHVGPPGRARELIANAQPVTAEWIPWEYGGKASTVLVTCSSCKRGQWNKNAVWEFVHCPKCGAKINAAEMIKKRKKDGKTNSKSISDENEHDA